MLLQRGARAVRADSAQAGLRRDVVKVSLGLRDEVEFWGLIADGADQVDDARLAGFTAADDAARCAGTDHGTNRSATHHFANFADIDVTTPRTDQAGIAGINSKDDSHRIGKPFGLSGRAGSIDLADTFGLAGSAGVAGNIGLIDRGDHRQVAGLAGATAVSSAGRAATAEPVEFAGKAGKAGKQVGGSG